MTGALIQLVALIFLLKDLKVLTWTKDLPDLLCKVAILFFIVKNVLQAISALPSIADLAYLHRNYIIAYLHMVLVGFISFGALALVLKRSVNKIRPAMKAGVALFGLAFVVTETLLVLNAAGIIIYIGGLSYLQLMFVFSSLFPVSIFLILTRIAAIVESKDPERQIGRRNRALLFNQL